MKYLPGIDIIVVNYRTPHDLSEFLTSLDRFSPSCEWSIVVLNVDPLEEDEKVARDWVEKHEEASYRKFDTNVGYAHAVNTGATYGFKECLGIFNADVVLTDRALDDCYAALMAVESRGALGPRQVDTHGCFTAAGIFGTGAAPKHRGWKEQDRGQYRDVRDDAICVAGSALFTKRSVWSELHRCELYKKACPDPLGAFPPTPFYFEDSYYCLHALSHGYKLTYYGRSTITHRWHNAVKTNDKESWAMRQWNISQEMFREACDIHSIQHD